MAWHEMVQPAKTQQSSLSTTSNEAPALRQAKEEKQGASFRDGIASKNLQPEEEHLNRNSTN